MCFQFLRAEFSGRHNVAIKIKLRREVWPITVADLCPIPILPSQNNFPTPSGSKNTRLGVPGWAQAFIGFRPIT